MSCTRRQSIYIPGLSHKNPIPAACRIGNMVYSGGIHGVDPDTGAMPDALDRQAVLMFGHMQTIVEAAGGSLSDIIKVTVWLRDRKHRPLINGPWLEMFPDPETRPARHTMNAVLDGEMQVQCDFIAVLPADAPRELPL